MAVTSTAGSVNLNNQNNRGIPLMVMFKERWAITALSILKAQLVVRSVTRFSARLAFQTQHHDGYGKKN